MNANIIIQIIILILTAMTLPPMVIYAGNILFKDKKDKMEIKKAIFPIIIYSLFGAGTEFIMDRFLKTIVFFVAIIVLYKIIYKNDWFRTIISSLILYITILVSEIIFSIIIGIAISLKINVIVNFLSISIILNIIIFSTTAILIKRFRKTNAIIINNIEKHRDNGTIVMFILLLIILTILLTRIDLRNNILKYDFFINIFICIIILIILFMLIKQKNSYRKFLNKYKQLTYYTNLHDGILEEYRIKNHEYKNQLAIIKSLISPNNKELNEYVNNLISQNKKIKYSWINQIKYLNLAGLKGLLNYKISEFKDLNLNISINISKSLEKYNFENLSINDKDNLYTIIGVYLDNAKEAANESEEKRINIDISENNNEVIFIIANTYKGKIDNYKLDNYRYSTKGKERGIGLYLVKNIINKAKIFNIERKITDKYYIQTLYIKK